MKPSKVEQSLFVDKLPGNERQFALACECFYYVKVA